MGRNLSLVSINYCMVKFVLLYVVPLKVSELIEDVKCEDLLYT